MIFKPSLIEERLRPLLLSEAPDSSIAVAAKALIDCHQVLNQGEFIYLWYRMTFCTNPAH